IASAFELVNRIRRSGAEARVWAARTNEQARRVLTRLRKIPASLSGAQPLLERQFVEMAAWQDNVSRTINGFVDKSEDLLSALKQLNPPLTSERLKPFRDAIQSERRITLHSLEMLGKTVEELLAVRTEIAQQDSRILLYHPAP